MDLYIMDTNFNIIDVIDTYESLVWAERYYTYGDFELYTPITQKFLDELKQDNYVMRRDSETVMIIDKIQINTDVEDGNYLTVTGKSLESILDRRIVWGQKTISGNLQNGIKTLLNENIINPSISNRKISNFVFEDSTDPIITSLTVEAQYTGDNLYDVVSNLCMDKKIGYRVRLNESKQFVFKLYSGVDRSYEQTANPYVIFSPKYDNLMNTKYIESQSALKNVTLVGGDGEGPERKYYSVGSTSGLARRELFTDARDISSTDEEGTEIPINDYNALLEQRGREKLGENVDIQTFEGEIEVGRTFTYGVDYDMGDVVEVENEYGISAAPRVIEIVECIDESGYSMVPTFDMDNIDIVGPDEDAVFLTTAAKKVLAKASGGVLVLPRTGENVGREAVYSNELGRLSSLVNTDLVIVGRNNDFLSIPFSSFKPLTVQDYITALERTPAESGTTSPNRTGLSVARVYNNGYPTAYGNVIRINGDGQNELLLGWSGSSGAKEKIYYRNKRGVAEANWSDWDAIATELYVNNKVNTDLNSRLSYSSGHCSWDATNVGNSSGSQLNWFKWGRVVAVQFWIKMTSSVSGTYTGKRLAYGLPNAIAEQNSTAVSTDGVYSSAFVGITTNGELWLNIRGYSMASKIIVGGFMYISAS